MVNFRLKEIVLSIASGITINHSSKGTYPVYGSTGIIGYTNSNDYSGERILIARVGANAGATNIVCGEYGVSDNTLVITVNSEYETKYIYYFLKHKKLNQFVFGSGQPLITGSLLKNISLYIPDRISQQHIAEALSDVDGMISSLEKLIAKYKSIKTACLQQMFPQNGETVPRMRLPGFTGAWEQRKLGEIGSVSMCRRIFKEQTSETGDIPFYKIGTFGAEPDAFISRELFEEYKSKYPYPKKGDILISASGSIGRTVEFAGNNEYFQDSNIVWLSHDERLSNSFLKCFYSVVKWAGIEGSTIKRLYNDNILNTVICMPSVPEQEHIGLFFENLDNLITLHQRKLEKIQKIKQGMMQQLLTGKIRLTSHIKEINEYEK